MTGVPVRCNHIGNLLRFGFLWIFLACGLPVASAAAQPELSIEAGPAKQHILLLYAYGYGGRGVELFSDGFFKAITAEGFPVSDIYAEYLDLQRRKDDPEYRHQLLDFLRRKYASLPIDLVVTIQQPALDLLLNEGKEIAPGAPVITIQPPPFITEAGERRIVGELSRFDIKGTLERALELFPQTRRVLFVSGSSAADSKIAEEAARVASLWQGKLEFEYTTGLSLEDILYKVAHLPPRTIIVFTQYNVDTKGRVALAYEIEGKITKVANAPVFGFYDYNLRNGGIGGSVIAVERLGESAGRLAVDILNGTFEPTGPVTLRENEAVPMFDWEQIQRWGGNAGRLPENTVFINRSPSAWEQYKHYIVGVVVFTLVELFLIVVLMVNIRRRDVAEAARTESEATARTLLNIPNAAAFLLDPKGICLDANDTMADRFSRKISDIIGTSVWDIFPPEVSMKRKERFHEALRMKKQIHFEDERGGMWHDSIISPIFDNDGEVSKVAVFSFDITERKRAEIELEQRQTDLLEIQHIGKIASLNWDLQNDTIQWTPELFSIVERDPRSFPHTRAGYLSLVHPEDRKLIEKSFEDSLPGDVAPYIEYRFVMPDGRDKYVGSQGKFIRDEKGHPVNMIGYIQDISERKQAEEEKRKLEEQLRQAQKMESVGRLAGGVAHDFNNMLGVILGHTEIALADVDPAQPLHKDLEEIHKAAQRSANLTRQLLAFARKQTVSPKILDLNEIVESMLRMLQRLIGEDIELSWKPGQGLWPVKVDPAQVDQVLANLAVNARDAIAGVGIVTIETSNIVVDESYGLSHIGIIPGQYVLLTVTDTGIGMNRETIDHLFEPFFTTKEVGKGTGLGLATVYGIVKQNNGFVNVYSEPGHGSSFKIYLPRAHTVAALEPAAAEQKPSHGVETILLVEDEESMLNLGAAILKRHGYTVLTAQAPGEALTLMERYEGPIHLVITDVVMPEMNGKVLMEKLQVLRPTVKALFMSGYTANAIAHHGVLEEGVQFLEKPFSVRALTEKVRKVLDQQST